MLFHLDFDERMILPVPLDKVLTVVMVLVVIPIVVIPMSFVIEAVAIDIIAPVLFLGAIVLPRCGVSRG